MRNKVSKHGVRYNNSTKGLWRSWMRKPASTWSVCKQIIKSFPDSVLWKTFSMNIRIYWTPCSAERSGNARPPYSKGPKVARCVLSQDIINFPVSVLHTTLCFFIICKGDMLFVDSNYQKGQYNPYDAGLLKILKASSEINSIWSVAQAIGPQLTASSWWKIEGFWII